MNPFDSLATFALGWLHQNTMQDWWRLGASLFASAFVSFFGTLGLTTVGLLHSGASAPAAFAIGIAAGSLGMALSVLGIWLRSPLTKGIPILYPGRVEAARLEQLTSEGTVYSPNEKR